MLNFHDQALNSACNIFIVYTHEFVVKANALGQKMCTMQFCL
jgi:hypothetical protein